MRIEDMTLAEIACSKAGATRILRQFGIDFCCGGGRSLEEEAKRKKIPLENVVSALNTLNLDSTNDKDWTKADDRELIEFILERFHKRHRQQLLELTKLSLKVENVHSHSPNVPVGITEHLIHMQKELENHMLKEENILFPMIITGNKHMADGPISVMEAEHLEHGKALEEMLRLTNQLVLPDEACNSWRALYLGLTELKDDLMEHIHLENNILFKRHSNNNLSGCCGSCG